MLISSITRTCKEADHVSFYHTHAATLGPFVTVYIPDHIARVAEECTFRLVLEAYIVSKIVNVDISRQQ